MYTNTRASLAAGYQNTVYIYLLLRWLGKRLNKAFLREWTPDNVYIFWCNYVIYHVLSDNGTQFKYVYAYLSALTLQYGLVAGFKP